MSAVDVQSQSQLFDGSSGDWAPFKAEFVSSLVSQNLDAEINQIVRMWALRRETKNDIVDALVKALREERTTDHKFPMEIFGAQGQTNDFKIGIIGGGIAGLYTAYILEKLNVEYEVLEGHSDRWGGRLYTHYFSDPKKAGTTHDYYDIGAMRFPNSPIMARTFDLFKRLDMGIPGGPRDDKTVLIPYYMTGKNCPTRYNDISAHIGKNEKRRIINKDGSESQDPPDEPQHSEDDPFKVSTANGGTVPATRVSHEATSEIFNDAYGRFRAKIRDAQQKTQEARNLKNVDVKVQTKERDEARAARLHAYEYLMRHDKYSLRDYLLNVEGYDSETCHWLETIDSASGWFDMAFTENVFESLAFDYSDSSNKTDKPEKPIWWYCINGGTSVTVNRILEKIPEKKRNLGMIVHKMALQNERTTDNKVITKGVKVTVRNVAESKDEERNYSAVVNTTTLGAMQKMDLTGMELPYGMKTAIRVLRYDTSTKVGIRFKRMWWMDKEFDITSGGVAKTDLPIRVCVYPSYNIDDKGEGVLLASYTWGQDSERIASHVSSTSPDGDRGMKELMVYNLARLHTLTQPEDTYQKRFENNMKTINDNWITHHAYDWSKDQFSAGAFALFSPGQFSTLIPHLVRPTSNGRLVIVGEHASANHAWIVGALDSAVRGLKQIFTRFNMDDKLKEMLDEFGDVDELKQELVAKQVILSMLTEDQMRELRLGRAVETIADVKQV